MKLPIKAFIPRKELRPYVQCYLIIKTGKSMIFHDEIIPTGHIQLIFHRSSPITNVGNGEIDKPSYIKGQYKNSYSISSEGSIETISVIIQPYSAKMILGIPANSFLNSKVSINDLEDIEFKILSDKVLNAKNNFTAINFIESFLLNRLMNYNKSYYIPSLARIIKRIEVDNNTKSEDLAGIICLSQKQFTRVFLENIGLMPKSLAYIIRFQQAINSIIKNPLSSMTQIAEDCGYTDQSHMIRSFQKITSRTPKELIAFMDGIKPYSNYYLMEEFINKQYNNNMSHAIELKTNIINLNRLDIMHQG